MTITFWTQSCALHAWRRTEKKTAPGKPIRAVCSGLKGAGDLFGSKHESGVAGGENKNISFKNQGPPGISERIPDLAFGVLTLDKRRLRRPLAIVAGRGPSILSPLIESYPAGAGAFLVVFLVGQRWDVHSDDDDDDDDTWTILYIKSTGGMCFFCLNSNDVP